MTPKQRRSRNAAIVLVCVIVAIAGFFAHRQHVIQQTAFIPHSGSATQFRNPPELSKLVLDVKQLRKSAAVLDPELLSWAPSLFNSQLKNPCWFWPQPNEDGSSAPDAAHASTGASPGGPESRKFGVKDRQLKTHCLPYAYISSFHTGAGALAQKLVAHPNVVFDAGGLSVWGPSWNWWSEYRNQLSEYLQGISKEGKTVKALEADPGTNIVIDGAPSTFALYWAGEGKAHRAFSKAAVDCWAECNRNHSGSAGPAYEKCMDTICLPLGRKEDYAAAARAGLDYKRDVHLPMLMRALYGPRPPKLVVLVRDPVDRIYSGYFGVKNMWEHHGKTTEGFDKFVAEQISGWKTCLAGTSQGGLDGAGGPPEPRTDEDCYYRLESLGMPEEKIFYHNDQLFRGLYAPYLRMWLRFLGVDNVLVLKSEDYFSDPDAVTNKVLRFLDLPRLPPPNNTWTAADTADSTVLWGGEGGSGFRGLGGLFGRKEGPQGGGGSRSQQGGAGESGGSGQAGPSAGDVAKPELCKMHLGTGSKRQFLCEAEAAKVRAAGPRKSNVDGLPPMSPATRRALAEFYAPYNRQLAELLGDPSILKWSPPEI